ncbi:MAG: hypothetical protein HC906_18250 [Bacteroidales bacterium]|nr:hypothetical protein [Bacteroidales bacterium]
MKTFELFHHYGLKRTECREGILNLILNARVALSENEIRDALKSKFDRTTFYRSLRHWSIKNTS